MFVRVAPLLLLFALSAGPVRGAIFTVTSNNNGGGGSLRRAINNANTTPGADTIQFAIGAVGSAQKILSVYQLLGDPALRTR